MPIPVDVSDRLGPTLAGDPHDHDAEIINSLDQDKAEPPKPADLPREPAEPLAERKAIQRLITGSLNLDPTWAAQLLLPADASRTHLRLTISSPVAADVVLLADDAGKLSSPGSAGQIVASSLRAVELPYTGPLWAACPTTAQPVTVSWMAVTK